MGTESTVAWLADLTISLLQQGWHLAKWTHRVFTEGDVFAVTEEIDATKNKVEDAEQAFHDYVRIQIICLWLFMMLYLFAYWIISKLKRKTEREALYAGEEDYFVYRFSVWICSISMGVSIGSLALLPFSVIGAELIQQYVDNYYLQWLSLPLINSLWNYVFVVANLSLFVLLPFAYFFIESQGFSTSNYDRNGITQRVYETLAISALFIVVVLCLAEIVLTILKYPVSFLSITSVNLPLIYSCVSLLGALILLISTPYGFAKMFSFAREFLIGEEVVKSEDEEMAVKNEQDEVKMVENEVEQVADGVGGEVEDMRKDSDSGIETGSMEEMRLDTDDDMLIDEAGGDMSPASKMRKRRKKHDYGASVVRPSRSREEEKTKRVVTLHDYKNLTKYGFRRSRNFSESDDHSPDSAFSLCIRQQKINDLFSSFRGDGDGSRFYARDATPTTSDMMFDKDSNLVPRNLKERRCKSDETLYKPSESPEIAAKPIGRLQAMLQFSENSRRGKMCRFLRGLRFPVVATILLILTTIALIMVAINTFKLLFGFRSLPVYAQIIEMHNRHSFGLFGACVEVLIIIYVMLTSFVGLYSMPLLRSLRPIRKDTSMSTIIINSSLVLIASSALPVIVNTLGMTTFDLLGGHSSLQWLSNFRVVVTFNVLFLIASIGCLFTQLTASMRKRIFMWITRFRCKRPTKIEEKME